MKNRKIMFLAVSLSIMTLLFVFLTYEPQAQNTTQRQQESDNPPTPIQLGVMTERQRKNSRLFQIPNQSKKTLLTDLKKSPQGFTYIQPGDPNLGLDPQMIPQQAEFIRFATCNADSVLIGRVIEKSSQITEDAKAIFTDYNLNVISVISSKPTLNLNVGQNITITKIGGSVLINNSRINYLVRAERELRIGTTYLLFLKYLPESDSYKTVNSETSFSIINDRLSRNNEITPPYKNINENPNLFINFIRESAAQCPATTGGNR